MGGFYERLVVVVKLSLPKAICKVCLTNKQLQTFIKEAEAVINSRPLVYVDEDINSKFTRSHFLTLNPKIGLPIYAQGDNDDDEYTTEIPSADRLLITWKKGLKHLNALWKIWRDDYLLSLRERSQVKLKESRILSPYSAKIGDVILIRDNLPRGSWRMGRIHELINSKDGQIRSAKVCFPQIR